MEETIYILTNGNEVPESWLLEQAKSKKISLEELLSQNPDISVKPEELSSKYFSKVPTKYNPEDWKGEEKQEELTTLLDKYLNKESLTVQEELLVSDYIDSDDFVQDEVEETEYPEKLVGLDAEGEQIWETVDTGEKAGAREITFDEFDAFESEDEALEVLERKYGDFLEFDIPFIVDETVGGGWYKDVIQVINKETGETFDLFLNTAYNRKNHPHLFKTGMTGKDIYNKFISFAMGSRFGKDGKPITSIRSLKDLESFKGQFLLDDGTYQQVTPEITEDAIELIRKDKTGTLTPEAAINRVIYSPDEYRSSRWLKWNKNLLNEVVKEKLDTQDQVDVMIQETGFNPNDISKEANVNALVALGMPAELKEGLSTAQYQHEGLLNVSGEKHQADKVIAIRNWLNTTEKGQWIINKYNQVKVDEEVKEISDEWITKARPQIDKSKYSDKGEYEKAVRKLATELQDEELDVLGDKIITAEYDDFGMSKEIVARLFELRDKIKTLDVNEDGVVDDDDDWERNKLEYKYLNVARAIVGDSEIRLLKNADGTWKDGIKQEQKNEVLKKQQKQLADFENYLISSSDDLNNVFNRQNAELYTITKELVRKGYSETMIEGSTGQKIGELYGYLTGGEGTAYKDFEKLKKWVETGEMPIKLTTLPTGNDPLIAKYNDLLQDRTTLLLAKSLLLDPSTFGRAKGHWYSGVERMFDAMNENWLPAIGGEQLGEAEMRNRFTQNILKNELGFELTEQQNHEASLQIDTWERSGASVPGFTRMAAEMALTYALTGGVGNLTNFISGIARNSAAFAVKKWGLSLGSAKIFSKYATGVGVEYIGLLGSNTIASGVFRQEGIESPLLFAMGSRFGHGLLAKTGNMYSSAIKKYAAKNPRFRRNLDRIAKFPGTASALGAIKTAAAPVGGVVGIKSGEFLTGLSDVAFGDKNMSTLWNEVTDSDSLMETYMALLFMRGSRPDQFVKQAVKTFRHEVDVLKGNNPGWNQLRRTLGMKTTNDTDESYKDSKTFDQEVDVALEIKINELKQKKLPPKQYQEQLRILKFSANRLKLKPALDQISRDFKGREFLRNELISVANNLAQSGVELSVDNILILSESGWGNGGSSPVLELMANGFTKIQATNLYKFSQRIQSEGMIMFGNNVNAPGFKKYIKESIKESQLDIDLSSIENQMKEGSISSSAYEVKKSQIEFELKEIDLEKKRLINEEAVERAGRSAKTIKEYREAGFDIIEGGNEVIAKARKEIGGKFTEKEIGLQGIDPRTGKGVILINTDAQARFKKGSTIIHEGWHFPFEKKLNSMSKKEAIKYVKDFEQALKNKGLHAQVLQEMFERSGFVNEIIKTLDITNKMWNTLDFDAKVKLYEKALKKGMKMPLSEAKEFINEFIELENDGRFDYAIGSKKIKKIRKENKEKEVTDIEFKTGKDIVDFVMSGGTRRTGVVKALAESKTEYEASMKGKKSELSASERKIKELEKMDNEALVETANLLESGSTEKGHAIEALINKNPIIWQKLGYNRAKGDVLPKEIRNSVIDELLGTYGGRGILKTYNPTEFGKFSTYLGSVIFSRKQQIYQRAGLDAKKFETDRLDAEHTREIAAEGTPETDFIESEGEIKTEVKEKVIDPLVDYQNVKDYKGKKSLEDVVDIEPSDVAMDRAGGFKGIQEKYGNKIAAELFDIPVSRIEDIAYKDGKKVMVKNAKGKLIPKKYSQNLTYAKKFVDGIPESSQAGRIQKAFSNPETARKFLQNLGSNTADLTTRIRYEKDGEVVVEKPDVSRDVRGISTGINNTLLKYLFDPVINPKTGKIKRSSGLTSQTDMYKPKVKFKNPSNKTIREFQEKLGITEAKTLNKYNRNIGTFLKGIAKLQGGQVANTIYRNKVKAFDKAGKLKTSVPTRQILADIKAGANRMQASEKGAGTLGQHDAIRKITGELDRTDPESVKRMKDVILKDMVPVFKELIYALIKPSTIGAAGVRATTKSKRGAVDRGFLWINDVISGRKQTSWSLSETQAYVEAGLLGEISTLIKAIEAKGIKEKSRKDRGLEESFASEQTLKNIDYNLENLTELQKAYKNIIKKFKKVYDNNPDTLPVLKEFFYHPNANAHIGKNFSLMRSKQKGATETNKYEEHGYQFSNWAKRTLEAITHKDPKVLKGWLDWSAKNYYQTAFNKTTKMLSIKGDMRTYQGIVDLTYGDWKAQSQEHPFLKEALDKAFKTGDFSKVPTSEIRFFNEHFTLNPNILFKDGKSFAKIYDVEVPKELENNPNIIKLQGRLIFEQMTTLLTAKQAREIIKLVTRKEIVAEQNKARKFDLKELEKPGVFNLSERMSTGDLVNKAGNIDKALNLARKIKKPIKKARVFDFDDTVAKTKSSVTYTKPNTTGKPSSNLKAIVMAGGPGSGKSTVIRKLGLQNQGYKVVNQDISLEWAKKLVGLDAKEAAYDAIQRSVRSELGALSRKIADKKLDQYTTEGKGVILDGTGASIKATEAKIKALKDKGYEVSMIYVETSKEIALDRNRNRKERSLKDKIVETTWNSVNANKQAYKNKFGGSFFEVNTNESIKKLPNEIVNNINSKLNETIRGKISPAEFAKKGEAMEAEGAVWDFSEFNKVIDGKKGPLFEVMKKMKEAAGERDMFILTARAPEAAKAIQRFLKEMGINIPLENIKGLGDSSPKAKSDWILEKAAEGYNDFYFADDHAPNVKAVKDALSRLHVKGKTQQAKVKFNKSVRTDLEKNENYKKFRDLIANEELFHGGSETLGDFNAVWFVTGDVKGAWSYALENDSRVYSVKAKDLKDTIIIPDMNDAKGFYDFAKEKFPNQIDAIQNRMHGSGRLIDGVDIKRVLEQPNASEILNEFINWSQDNFNMGAFPLGSNRAINSLYDGKSITKGLPVIVVKRPSNWESNPKLVTEVSMRDVYREEKVQEKKDARKKKVDARKESWNKAVQKVLNVIDIKRPIQKNRMNASERLDKEFNKILEEKSGIEWYKEYSETKGKIVGARKGKGKFFLPPGAEDFTGLIYPTLGKGKKGEAQLKWYNDNLIKPYNRATRNLAADKIQLMTDFKGLKKQLDIPKDLRKNTDIGYTKEQIARIYLWDKMGEEIPGISKKDLKEVLEVVNKDAKLRMFADQILEITKGDGYSKPSKEWLAGTITTDLINLLNKTKRNKYLQEWNENINVIFSKKNLNKLEAIYGSKYRTALENSIQRMKTGRNRTSTGNKASDALLDYINGAQGTIMFLNMRSAVLQSISAANFINLSFNNPIKAGRAFINQKRYWKDFMSIMNSDYLVGRRQGLKLNISESEISEAAAGSTNKAKAVINYILEKGYAPTKFMDSFAIASGGATWYRNKIKDLMKKEGLSEVEAQKIAFEEFMEISEKSQQSSDPSKISAQQASDMGRVFLQFVNTPMQYVRLQKRAFQDLTNKRGDWKSNISKILYYGVVQNIWFNAMQQGLFALGFGDDEINEKEETKIINTANGMADSILRGTGFVGMTLSVLKNTVIDLYRRSGKKLPNYRDAWIKLLEFSPAVKSKVSKLRSAAWPFDTKAGREEIAEKGFSLDNPAYESLAKIISAATNIPLDRLYLKYNNLEAMMSEDTEIWKDVALFLGWPEWQLEEGGTKADDLSRNITELNKVEQIIALEKLGVSADEIKDLKKEGDRVNKMMELYNKDKEKVLKILNEELKAKPKTKEDELKIKIYKYSQKEQVMILERLGVNRKSIKDLKTEKQRVDKINSLYNENSKDTDKVFSEVENYVPPKPSKREVRFEKLKDKSKNEQTLILLEYGLTMKEIRGLYYENNRVSKIIELQDK